MSIGDRCDKTIIYRLKIIFINSSFIFFKQFTIWNTNNNKNYMNIASFTNRPRIMRIQIGVQFITRSRLNSHSQSKMHSIEIFYLRLTTALFPRELSNPIVKTLTVTFRLRFFFSFWGIRQDNNNNSSSNRIKLTLKLLMHVKSYATPERERERESIPLKCFVGSWFLLSFFFFFYCSSFFSFFIQ